MHDIVHRALTLWRAWRARKVFGPQINAAKTAISKAQRNHKAVRHLQRRLREATHARLRAELGVRT